MSPKENIYSDRRIVITGLGTINPLANDIEGYWKGLQEGRSVIRQLSGVDLGTYPVRMGGQVDYPENLRSFFKQPKMIKRLDRNIIFAQVAGAQAFEDSGLDMTKVAYRCGVIMGTGSGGVGAHQKNIFSIHDNKFHEVSPFYLISAIPSTTTTYFTKEFGMKGPIFSVCSACASANHAFGLSAMLIKSGMADVMFAGGSESAVNTTGMVAFGNIGALSQRTDAPHLASRPFDIDRDGFLMGEGAGVLCLEALEHAQARGAKIYGELTGFGFTSDANDLVAPHPEAEGAVRAMKSAINMAGIQPEDIGLINAHGTSTPIGDKIEGLGINKALGKHGSKVLVHSTKSIVGHLLGAASAVEAQAALMVFEKNIVHPTANLENQDPEINLNVVSENMDGSHINHIMSNAFGFGGMNGVVIFSRFKD